MLPFVTQQSLLDALPSATAIVDEEGTIVAANRRWAGFAEEDVCALCSGDVGGNYLEICAGASDSGADTGASAAGGLRAVLAGEAEFRCEYPCRTRDGQRWIELSISPLQVAGRRLAMVMHHDITARRREAAQAGATHEELNRIADLVASSTDPIISFDLDGRVLTWNPAATALYGYRPDEIIGRSLEVLYPEGWPVRVAEYRDLIMSGALRQFEATRKAKSGELREVSISAAPVRGPAGEIVAIQNIHRDNTEAKSGREHLALLTRELSHRAKNLLAVVLAVERQTALVAGSLDDFHERFSARLKALGASIDLLAARNWGRVSLAELVRRQLAAFGDPDARNIAVDGPEVLLDGDAIEAIGMAVHELATNALKYGALGPAGGSVRLGWNVEHDGGAPVLAIRWEESSPAIEGPPESTGFGHAVITRVPAQKLNADVSIDFQPGRLVWRAVLPRQHFVPAR